MSRQTTKPKCGHCHKAIIRCDVGRIHDGCDQAKGWIHYYSKRHECEGIPGQYAQPATEIEKAASDD